MKKIFLSFLVACTFVFAQDCGQDHFKPDYRPQRARALLATVDYFESLFWTQYAPFKWKQHYWKWDPSTQARHVKDYLQRNPSCQFDYVKRAFNRYLGSCKDAHVHVDYADRRLAYIPIFVDWINDQIVVTFSHVSTLAPGDQIITINGMPALDYFSTSLYGACAKEAPLNRLGLNMRRLFFRIGSYDAIPDTSQPLKVLALAADNKTQKNVTLYWTSKSFKQSSFAQTPKPTQSASMQHFEKIFTSYIDTFYEKYRLALRQINDEFSDSGSDPSFLSQRITEEEDRTAHYLTKKVEGLNIGYLRIPDFIQTSLVSEVQTAIQAMANTTQALIIDIRDNPGGEEFKCWAILSMLTDKPLTNLLESLILDQQEIDDYEYLRQKLEEVLALSQTDQDLHLVVGESNFGGYHLSKQLLINWVNFLNDAIDDWHKGFTCTRFGPIRGERFIQPHPTTRYTKPIFLLVNEKSISCADMFPAILKDNERATLLGRTTCGAGGMVRKYEIPNFTGIESFSLTKSLCLRNNQLILEDLGVDPHYEYARSLSDCINPDLEVERAFEFAAKKLQESTVSK